MISAQRRTTFVGPQKNLRENDTVKSGSLEKLAEKGKSWHQRWAMLKFRTVYLFEKTDVRPCADTYAHAHSSRLRSVEDAQDRDPFEGLQRIGVVLRPGQEGVRTPHQ